MQTQKTADMKKSEPKYSREKASVDQHDAHWDSNRKRKEVIRIYRILSKSVLRCCSLLDSKIILDSTSKIKAKHIRRIARKQPPLTRMAHVGTETEKNEKFTNFSKCQIIGVQIRLDFKIRLNSA